MNSLIAQNDRKLILVEQAKQMLAECRSMPEAKQLRDQAAAVQAYLAQQKGCEESMNDAAEIKLRAERRLGELLAETTSWPPGR